MSDQTKSKLGRPELPEDEKQSSITAVRLKPDERQLVEQAATKQEQKLSDWMRDTLLGAAKRQLKAS